MVKSSATICTVPQLQGGPFIFWEEIPISCKKAATAGFDAVEILAPSAEAINKNELQQALISHNLCLSALGTGAGFVMQKLHLCAPEAEIRHKAVEFISSFIDLAGCFNVPVIIGSMKGSVSANAELSAAWNWLRDGLEKLANRAKSCKVPLLLEPLNRYETNLINCLDEGIELIESLQTDNVKLLADLFHMNIEEQSIPKALLKAASHIGHIHFVDSNRRAAGFGHIDFAQVRRVLDQIRYNGYLSAEAMAYPNSESAAEQTIKCFRKYFHNDLGGKLK